MKKIISIIMVCSIICSVLGGGLSAFGTNDGIYDDVQLLTELKIIPEMPALTEMENGITRAEFAIFLSNILGENAADTTKQYFYDVPSKHYAFEAVSKLTSLGIISASEDGMFNPSDKITVNEAIKLICELLGYGEYATVRGSYPYGYLSTIRQLNINVPNGDALTMKNGLNMIFQVMTVQMYDPVSFKMDSDGNISIDYEVADNTLLSRYFNIYKTTAVINSAGGRSVSDSYKTEKDELIADGVKYNTGIDFENELGRYSTFYYRQRKNDKTGEIIYKGKCENPDKTVIINSDDFLEYRNGEVLYYSNDKIKSARIPSNIVIVKNGTVAGDNNSELLNIKNGSLKLIDTYNAGTYNLAVIEEYYNIFSDRIDSDEKCVYDEDNKSKKVNLNDDDRMVSIRNLSGGEIAFEELKAGSLISVFESENYVKAIVSSDARNEVVFEKSVDNSKMYLTVGKAVEDKKKLVIEDYYYKSLEGKKNISPGGNITYYLDAFGKIGYLKTDSTSNGWCIGYMYKHGASDDFEPKLKLKIFTQYNACETLCSADKVIIDGEVKKTYDDMLKALDKVSSYGKTLETDEDAVDGQLLRFKRNSKGEITEIDTERYNSNSEEKDTLTRTVNIGDFDYIWSPQSFNGVFVRGGSTVLLHVPSHSELKDAKDKDFFIPSNSWLVEANYHAEAFKTDKNAISESAIVIYNKFMANKYSEPGLVKSVSEALDSEGNIVKKVDLCMLISGAEKSYLAACDSNFDEVDDSTGATTGYCASDGDIIRVQTNPSGDVNAVKIIYDYSRRDDAEYNNALPFGALITNVWGTLDPYYKYQMMRGYVKRVDNEACTLLYSKPSAADYTEAQIEKANYKSKCSFGLSYVYNSEKRTVEKTYDNKLISADTEGFDNAEPYIIIAPDGVISGAVIYK